MARSTFSRARGPAARRLVASACLLASACRAPAVVAPPIAAPPAPLAAEPHTAELELPAGWSELAPAEFEAALERWTPPGERRDPAAPLAAELTRALAAGGPRALRAALVLARARGPVASESLLAHLERGGAGPADEAALVAARAFALGATARDSTRRLAALATGARAHVDPAVRVECAASALFGGEPSARALLAAVWIGTAHFGLGEDELAPLQERALAALAEAAGTEPRATPWAPQRVRVDELARIDALLNQRAAR